VNSEVFDLHRIRLDREYTFDVLADRIGISRRNLFRLFRHPHVRMHALTRAKIQRFIRRHGQRNGRRRSGIVRRLR
jgi:transcriptional regulator GlxA family with amidase domain